MESGAPDSIKPSTADNPKHILGGLALCVATAASFCGGFIYSVGAARKRDSAYFGRGQVTGIGLAFRALARGTLWATGGVSLITLTSAWILGVKSLPDFRRKMEVMFRAYVPAIPRNNPQGRTDFASFRELFEYLEETSKEKKEGKDIDDAKRA